MAIDDFNVTNNKINNTSMSNSLNPVIIPILCSPHSYSNSNNHEVNTDSSNNRNLLDEWAMIEINGELFVPSSATTTATSTDVSASTTTIFDTTNRIELGSITFIDPKDHSNNSNDTMITSKIPIMILGTHELRGTIVKLAQPFLCLQKKQQQHSVPPSSLSSSFNDTSTNGNSSNQNNVALTSAAAAATTTTTSTSTSYDIMGVVNYKLVFNQYPKTIMR